MLRRLFAGLLFAGMLSLVAVSPAVAQPPVTETNTAKDVGDTFVDVGPPCGGDDLYTVTTTTNVIEHATLFPDGRAHFTFTQSGTFVAVPTQMWPPASGVSVISWPICIQEPKKTTGSVQRPAELTHPLGWRYSMVTDTRRGGTTGLGSSGPP